MKRLIEIQSKLNAPKGQYNSFGKYHYRSCEDILEAVKPLLKEQKLSLVITDDVIEVGNRVFLKATCVLYGDDSKELARNSALAEIPDNKKGMDLSQITGASSSYARKYALNGLLCIDDNKDADTHPKQEEPQKSKSEPTIQNAIDEIKKCKNLHELRIVKGKYPDFQNDTAFIQAGKEMVLKLQ